MSVSNSNFDLLVTTTLQKYRKQMIENLLGQHAFYWSLKQYSMVTSEEGSRSIVVPTMYGDATTVRSYDKWDPVDVTPTEGISASEFSWKHLIGGLPMAETEIFLNAGSATKVLDMWKTKVRQLEISFQKEMNIQLFGDGTGNDGKDLTGLALAVEDGAAWSEYGGVDSNVWTYWRNQYLDVDATYGASAAFLDSFGGSCVGMSAFRKMFLRTQLAGESTGLIVTTVDIAEAYEQYGEPKQRVASTNQAMFDAGFKAIEFKGIPIIHDPECDANTALFLNPKHMKLVFGKGREFVVSPVMRPITQDSRVIHIAVSAQLVCDKRDTQGRITNLLTA